MKSTTRLLAQFVITSLGDISKSNAKTLKSFPATTFQYFLRFKLNQLYKNVNRNQIPSQNHIECDIHFKRYIRNEWDALSLTKKRIYSALHFHNEKIDHKNMSMYDLAKMMEVPLPALSEYMLFRNKFKEQFVKEWNLKKDSMSLAQRNPHAANIKQLSALRRRKNIKINSSVQRKKLSEIINFTQRFQEMCKECRNTWNTKISNEEKAHISAKWQQQKSNFEEKMHKELTILEHNLQWISEANDQEPSTQQPIVSVETSTIIKNKPIEPCLILKKKSDS